MLKPSTVALLKEIITTIPHPHPECLGAFRKSDLVERLTERLPELGLPIDRQALQKAERIVRMAADDNGTAPDGMIHFPPHEPYAYHPDQLIPDGNGYLCRLAECTPEFVEHDAWLSRLKANYLCAERDYIHACIAAYGAFPQTKQEENGERAKDLLEQEVEYALQNPPGRPGVMAANVLHQLDPDEKWSDWDRSMALAELRRRAEQLLIQPDTTLAEEEKLAPARYRSKR